MADYYTLTEKRDNNSMMSFCYNHRNIDEVMDEKNMWLSNEYYKDVYLIYIDKLGIKFEISEKDSIYDNRKGLYRLTPFYELSACCFNNSFGGEYKFYGFTDTVLAVVGVDKSQKVAHAACKAFLNLLKFSLPIRVIISRGDFGVLFPGPEVKRAGGMTCPVYGSALLKAYELDQKGIECYGVFVHESARDEIEYLPGVIDSNSHLPLGFISYEKYYDETDIEELKSTVIQNANIPDFIEEKKSLSKCPAIKAVMEGAKDFLNNYGLASKYEKDTIEALDEGIHLRIESIKKTKPYYDSLLAVLKEKNVKIKTNKNFA